MSAMKSCRQRIEALEKQTGATGLVSTFILAPDRTDADRQVRQYDARHPDCRMTLFVMIGPTAAVAP